MDSDLISVWPYAPYLLFLFLLCNCLFCRQKRKTTPQGV